MSLSRILQGARCVVCVGPGGVGKTSTSAALAMEGARQGRRTIVLTIDPAKRLANALGMPEIGNVERTVGPEAFKAAGIEVPEGVLTAMMLDIKQSWDAVVAQHHPDPERRQKLLDNRLYQALSTALAGSQEYMAMEKLHELSTREDDPLDLVVLDTPPSVHALDFLEAPSRMLEALDNDATRWLLEPYQERRGLAKRLFDAGSSIFLRTISRFTGGEMLEELAELLLGFQGMFEGFRQRAAAVRSILEAPGTVFVVVSAPTGMGADDARDFAQRLKEKNVRTGAVLLNRATVDPFGGQTPQPLAPFLAEHGATDLEARLTAVAEATRKEALAEAQRASILATELALPVLRIPQLPRDIHDLAGLHRLRQHLFEDPYRS